MAPHHELPFVYTPYTVPLAYAPCIVLTVPGMSAASTGAKSNRWVWLGTESRSSVQSGKNEGGGRSRALPPRCGHKSGYWNCLNVPVSARPSPPPGRADRQSSSGSGHELTIPAPTSRTRCGVADPPLPPSSASIPALASATPEQLADVELGPGGSGLQWEALDVDLSVAGLLLSSLGRSQKLSELARITGQVSTPAKAAAARANGAKGGRPRKVARRSRDNPVQLCRWPSSHSAWRPQLLGVSPAQANYSVVETIAARCEAR